MASIVFGGGVTAAVGSHAGNTFARNKGGAYMKKKSHGTNPRSSVQLRHRTKIGQVSKNWSFTMSDAQRTAWNAYASTTPVINRLGNTSFLSGQQMFSKLNAVLLEGGIAIVNTPPATNAVGTPSSLGLTPVAGTLGSLHIHVTTSGATADDACMIWVSPPLNPGRSFVSSVLRKLPGFYTIDTTNNVTTDYEQVFGVLPTAGGQRLIVRTKLVNTTTGVTSGFFQDTAMWV